jgi:hypothetical protein
MYVLFPALFSLVVALPICVTPNVDPDSLHIDLLWNGVCITIAECHNSLDLCHLMYVLAIPSSGQAPSLACLVILLPYTWGDRRRTLFNSEMLIPHEGRGYWW